MDEMLAATASAEETHFWFRGLRRVTRQLLEAELGSVRPRRIVDCGCGTGRNIDWLTTLGPTVGIELSPTGLHVARAHRRPVVQASVLDLPLPDASVDLATSFDVFYCLDDAQIRRALAEMHRVLVPGGLALFNVAALAILRGSHSALSGEVRRYTPATLRRDVETAGFRISRLTFTNCFTFPVTLAARLSDRLLGRAHIGSTADLQVPAAPINTALDLALRAEAAALRITNMPIGSSLLCLARKR